MPTETNQTSKNYINISLAGESLITPLTMNSGKLVDTPPTDKNQSPSDKMEKYESELGAGIKFSKTTLTVESSQENDKEQ